MERASPTPCMVDRNQVGYLRSKGSQPHTTRPSPGFWCQQCKSPSLLAVKTGRGGAMEETAGLSGVSS